jgi:diaminopimelate decarboxylase/aspartate kinase
METQWWQPRRDELLALAGQATPLYVFNEETLNDTLFDLLSMEALGCLLYPVHANPHPKMLRKAFEQGVGFWCISRDEMDGLLERFPYLDPQRIVFSPNAPNGRDFERAFDKGACAVVSDLNVLTEWPDVFRGRRVFIHRDLGSDEGRLQLKGIPVQGFYTLLKGGSPSACSPDDTVSLLTEASRHFPEAKILILGNRTEQAVDNGPERMDIPEIGNYLDAIVHACPGFNLWVELPNRMLARAGVLMVRVVEADGKSGSRCIRVNADLEALSCQGRCGISHGIVNLSRPDSDETISPTCVIGEEGGPEYRIDLSKAPASIEKGDILAFTNMGAPGAEKYSTGKGWHAVSQHYLNARKMCPVRI